eukprot:CAMPEP_0117449792 /NCGR_PEP_ID=MMETSP0759-20121206/8126_1 /TAXON_ID=63605 /ORGANISM="Percolomonas cosmopolitus, Strain WS" /LENGTH=62 /DNA_ID=CAMNT_0005242275 /DNA_START=290 /DNA_END=478 /DNA_ORIENTATION=-
MSFLIHDRDGENGGMCPLSSTEFVEVFILLGIRMFSSCTGERNASSSFSLNESYRLGLSKRC